MTNCISSKHKPNKPFVSYIASCQIFCLKGMKRNWYNAYVITTAWWLTIGATKNIGLFSVLYCYLWQGVTILSLVLDPHLRPWEGQLPGQDLILDALVQSRLRQKLLVTPDSLKCPFITVLLSVSLRNLYHYSKCSCSGNPFATVKNLSFVYGSRNITHSSHLLKRKQGGHQDEHTWHFSL